MRFVTTFGFVALVSSGLANDAWIGSGGVPHLMSGHPSVRMMREVVNITVGERETSVDAHFWFRNDGPATTVRMGFPDEDSGWDDMDSKKPVFSRFESWVAGRKVKTDFTGGNGRWWHVKSVRIPSRSTLHVRNAYQLATGGALIREPDSVSNLASYTLHTGRSWKGTIGETIVNIRFDRALPAPGQVRPTDEVDFANVPANALGRYRATVLWSGPATPKLRGRTLTFYRRNWEPTEDDDIRLEFFPRRDEQTLRRWRGTN